MKNILKGLVIILTVGFSVTVFSGFAIAQDASETGESFAAVRSAMTVEEAYPLFFGFFMSGPVGGTLSPDHTTITGDITSIDHGHDAAFNVTGTPSVGYNVTLDPTCTLSDVAGNGGTDMIATLSLPLGLPPYGLDAGGNGGFPVTGILAVGASQVASDYMGTYNVTVDY